MNRRAFITSLLATATLDPERLLWVPDTKRIFIPPRTTLIAINVTVTRIGGHLHNGLSNGGIDDYISHLPIGALDPICRKAYDDWRAFVLKTFPGGNFECEIL